MGHLIYRGEYVRPPRPNIAHLPTNDLGPALTVVAVLYNDRNDDDKQNDNN